MHIRLSKAELLSGHFHYHLHVPTVKERLKEGLPPVPTQEELEDRERQLHLQAKAAASKRRQPQEDYDMADPFIDDTDVVKGQFESVLLPSGSSLDENDEGGGVTAVAGFSGDVNFYVYRGPLEVDVIEKEFESPRKKKKRSSKKKSKGPSITKKADETQSTQQPSLSASSATATAAKKRSSKKKKDSSGPGKNKTLTDKLSQMFIESGAASAQPQMKSPVKRKSPKKSTSSSSAAAATSASMALTESEVLTAWCEYKEALMDFSQAATAIATFDPSKFPNQLRPQLEALLLAYLRLPSHPTPPDAFKDDSLLMPNVWLDMAQRVPYKAGAIKKLAVKKVMPTLLQTLEGDRTLETVGHEATLCAVDGAVPKFSEGLKRAVWLYVRSSLHKTLLGEALRRWDDPSDPSTLDVSDQCDRLSICKQVDVNATRRQCFAVVSEQFSVLKPTPLSKELSAYKRRLQAQMLRRHDIKLAKATDSKAPAVAAEAQLGSELFASQTPSSSQPVNAVDNDGPDAAKRMDIDDKDVPSSLLPEVSGTQQVDEH